MGEHLETIPVKPLLTIEHQMKRLQQVIDLIDTSGYNNLLYQVPYLYVYLDEKWFR